MSFDNFQISVKPEIKMCQDDFVEMIAYLSENGCFRYLLTIIDTLSKFASAIHVKLSGDINPKINNDFYK